MDMAAKKDSSALPAFFQLARFGFHTVGQLLLVSIKFFRDALIGGGDDLRREYAGIGRAGFTNGHGGDGNSRGHLHHREKRVEAEQGSGGNGDSDDRERGFGGDHAGQVGRAAGAGDDDLHATPFKGARVLAGARRRAMRRGDVDFVGNTELVEDFRGLIHDLEVGVADHNDGDKWGSIHKLLRLTCRFPVSQITRIDTGRYAASCAFWRKNTPGLRPGLEAQSLLRSSVESWCLPSIRHSRLSSRTTRTVRRNEFFSTLPAGDTLALGDERVSPAKSRLCIHDDAYPRLTSRATIMPPFGLRILQLGNRVLTHSLKAGTTRTARPGFAPEGAWNSNRELTQGFRPGLVTFALGLVLAAVVRTTGFSRRH